MAEAVDHAYYSLGGNRVIAYVRDWFDNIVSEFLNGVVMKQETDLTKWISSAEAWIADQGSQGDWSRRVVLDPASEKILPVVEGKTVLDNPFGRK